MTPTTETNQTPADVSTSEREQARIEFVNLLRIAAQRVETTPNTFESVARETADVLNFLVDAMNRVRATQVVAGLTKIVEDSIFEAGRMSVHLALQDAKRAGGPNYVQDLIPAYRPGGAFPSVIDGENVVGRERALELYRAGECEYLEQARAK